MWYIGQASNLAARLSQHFTQLVVKKHSCQKLQNDWFVSGQEMFQFIILKQGPQFDDPIVRLKEERGFIINRRNHCYNTMSTLLFNQKKPTTPINPI